jgi:GT2 family glycosyltransferase
MRFPDGTFQATCRKLPHFKNMLYSRGSIFSKILGNGHHYTLPDYDETTPIPAAAGTMMMIRNQLFKELGGFDKRFFMYMEDVDLCCRLSLQGYINYFVPSAGGVHLWGKGSRAGKFKRNLLHHYTLWKYFIKHHPSIRSYLLLPFILSLNLLLISLLPVTHPVNRK